jgi:F0F1-type ATP synthase membrane subunit b/b'
MTVAVQVKQTLAGLKSAQASFETFSLQTENEQAKQFYQNAAQQTQQLVDSLNTRVDQIVQEEPQYGGQ